MNGELILTDQEIARIVASELSAEDIITSNIQEGQEGNIIAYEMVLDDEQIAEVVKSYLKSRNFELEINNVVFVEKIADANKFTF